jgi:hypothetical protein
MERGFKKILDKVGEMYGSKNLEKGGPESLKTKSKKETEVSATTAEAKEGETSGTYQKFIVGLEKLVNIQKIRDMISGKKPDDNKILRKAEEVGHVGKLSSALRKTGIALGVGMAVFGSINESVAQELKSKKDISWENIKIKTKPGQMTAEDFKIYKETPVIRGEVVRTEEGYFSFLKTAEIVNGQNILVIAPPGEEENQALISELENLAGSGTYRFSFNGNKPIVLNSESVGMVKEEFNKTETVESDEIIRNIQALTDVNKDKILNETGGDGLVVLEVYRHDYKYYGDAADNNFKALQAIYRGSNKKDFGRALEFRFEGNGIVDVSRTFNVVNGAQKEDDNPLIVKDYRGNPVGYPVDNSVDNSPDF